MIGLIQRVSEASVWVQGQSVATIEQGLLVLVGIEHDDNEARADRLLQRLLGYRVFADHADKMNLSLQDINGGLLLVPQFTLPADTRKGMRPSFTPAASPAIGKRLFAYLLNAAEQQHDKVAAGIFAADMQVRLVNDGPATFWLQS